MKYPVFRLLKTNQVSEMLRLGYYNRGLELREEYEAIIKILTKLDPAGDGYIGQIFPHHQDTDSIAGYTINFYDESILNAFRIIYE